jgi:hypothetical protein
MRPPTAALVLSALLVLSGCLGVFSSAPSDPGAEAVVEEAVAAGETVETYRVHNELAAVGTSDGDRQALHVTAIGAVDRPARTIRMNATRGDDHRRAYVVENTTYTECAPPWDGWGKETREELDDDWSGHDPLGRQLTLLAESPVTWVGNTTLDGTAVHVVEARPSDRTLTQFSDEGRPLIAVFGPRIRNATFRAWIAADSRHVRKTRLAFDVQADESTVEARMTTRFTHYGADVEIALPEAATDDPFELGCPGE